MSAARGGARTLDLAVAPRRRWSGLLVLLVVVSLAAGSLYIFFLRSGEARPPPPESLLGDGREEVLNLEGLLVSFRVSDEWEGAARNGVVGFERPVDEGTLFLGFSMAVGDDARSCMSAFLAPGGGRDDLGGEVLKQRFRWIDHVHGLRAFCLEIGEPDTKEVKKPRHHVLWVQAPDGVIRVAYDVPADAPSGVADFAEQVIATLTIS